jgi:hypothetical protein
VPRNAQTWPIQISPRRDYSPILRPLQSIAQPKPVLAIRRTVTVRVPCCRGCTTLQITTRHITATSLSSFGSLWTITFTAGYGYPNNFQQRTGNIRLGVARLDITVEAGTHPGPTVRRAFLGSVHVLMLTLRSTTENQQGLRVPDRWGSSSAIFLNKKAARSVGSVDPPGDEPAQITTRSVSSGQYWGTTSIGCLPAAIKLFEQKNGIQNGQRVREPPARHNDAQPVRGRRGVDDAGARLEEVGVHVQQ